VEIPLSLILSFIALGWLSVATFRKMFSARTAPTAIDPTPAHRMVRVWVNNNPAYYSQRGWWYECSCGRVQPGQGVNARYMGSEGEAIKGFKAHAALYLTPIEAPVDNPFEKLYNDEVAAFQEYVSKCFCKDTNDDLLVLKHRHLDK
jgi:hypothetical protein